MLPPMSRLDPSRLERLLAGFGRLRLLVVGDVMVDEYLSGDVMRVSPEAPVPVLHVTRESLALGGAGNVVRNVLALGGRCELCSVSGEDAVGDRLHGLLEELGVDAGGVVRVKERPTTRKTRVEARSQQIVRLDRETLEPIPTPVARQLLRGIESSLSRVDGVILQDYGKGVLTPELLRPAMGLFQAAGVPVAVDPKHQLEGFRGATLVKPNLREVESLSGVELREEGDLERAARRLQQLLPGAVLAVTRGADGIALFEPTRSTRVPIARSEVFDVQGAGDTSIASLTLAHLAGASWPEAAVLANAAASVVVAKAGTATATPAEVEAQLPRALEAVRQVEPAP